MMLLSEILRVRARTAKTTQPPKLLNPKAAKPSTSTILHPTPKHLNPIDSKPRPKNPEPQTLKATEPYLDPPSTLY